MFAHSPGDMSGHHVAVFKFYLEERIGQSLENLAFHFNYIFFCHVFPCRRVEKAVLCHSRADFGRGRCKLTVMLVDTVPDLLKIRHLTAGIAQLVEHNLAKVGVASSSLVSRSKDY